MTSGAISMFGYIWQTRAHAMAQEVPDKKPKRPPYIPRRFAQKRTSLSNKWNCVTFGTADMIFSETCAAIKPALVLTTP